MKNIRASLVRAILRASCASAAVAAALIACSGAPDDTTSTSAAGLSAPGWSSTFPGYHRTEPLPDHVAYLTFDDGPGEWTEAFLDILHAEGVRATFFVNGKNLKKNGLDAYKATLSRMLREGHALGNHTLNHPQLTAETPAGVDFQLDENKRVVNLAIAPTSLSFDLIRPPFGAENASVQAEIAPRGFDTLWNVANGDSADWVAGEWFCDVGRSESRRAAGEGTPTDDDCVNYNGGGVSQAHPYDPGRRAYQDKVSAEIGNVLGSGPVSSGAGFVALMHDVHPTTRDALTAIIRGLVARGYVFETVEDLRQRTYGHPEYGASNASITFAETGKALQGRLRAFWEQNGGLPVFGFPKAGATYEVGSDGKTYWSQWFERAKLELHPENSEPYDVLLGLIGRQRLTEQAAGANTGISVDPAVLAAAQVPEDRAIAHPGCAYFEETKHWVCNQDGGTGFRATWESHGLRGLRPGAASLALFGYPITAVHDARRSSDNRPIKVQWFERARFEWHADNADPYRVLLGLLGK